jgi:hypothetical protein
METLDFQLLVFSPFRALDGLLASIVDTLHASDIKSERKQLEQTAAQIGKVAVEVVLTRGVYTDLVLLFRPNQIAFAALVHAAHQLSVYDGFVGAFVDVVAADSSSSSSNGSLPPAHVRSACIQHICIVCVCVSSCDIYMPHDGLILTGRRCQAAVGVVRRDSRALLRACPPRELQKHT